MCIRDSPEAAAQLAVTDDVLGELGCGDIPQIVVYNKCDRVDVYKRQGHDSAHPQNTIDPRTPGGIMDVEMVLAREDAPQRLSLIHI